MKINNVLIQPVVTEKATRLSASKVYAFQVNSSANKNQIAEALQKLYGVKVGEVKVVTRPGKIRKVGRRMQEKQLPDTKIAYVNVIEGKIDLFPQA